VSRLYKDVIGIVGGMGSFATCDLFRRLIEAFPAEKEWDRPRIVIDNNCTMPSRVRAIIYKEERPKLVELLTESVINLRNMGCTKIILACNTSHVFLEEIYELYEKKTGNQNCNIMNMIEIIAESLHAQGIKKVALMATEGTMDSKIYDEYLSKYGIEVIPPKKEDYVEFRYLIECVKQNKVDEEAVNRFINSAENLGCRDVILGCTEFPVFLRYMSRMPNVNLHDPLEYLITKLKKELM
jgi:aspartate racemase